MDLRIIYENKYGKLTRVSVDEGLARRAQSFNSEYFKTWVELEHGRVMAFNLGILVEKE